MDKDLDKVALLINCAYYTHIPGILSSSMDKAGFLAKAGFAAVFAPKKYDKKNIEEAIKAFLKIADKYRTRLVWVAGKFGDQGGAFLLPADIASNGMKAIVPTPKNSDEGIDIYPLFHGLEQAGKGKQSEKENYYIIESGYRFGNNQFNSISPFVQSAYASPAANINLDILPTNSVLLHIDGVAAARVVKLENKSRSYASILNSEYDVDKSLYDVFYQTAKIFNGAGLRDLQDKYKKFNKIHAKTAGLSLYDKRIGKTPRQVFSANLTHDFIPPKDYSHIDEKILKYTKAWKWFSKAPNQDGEDAETVSRKG